MRYGFGKNWDDWEKKHFSEERLAIARRHLLGFLRRRDLNGSSFLDIGCGSGLHSMAAYRAGARPVVSFDYDPIAVETTERLWRRAGSPGDWLISQGDVLDRALMASLAHADIVYSWGVLHHTGDLWRALENARLPLASDGVLYVALYCSEVYIDPPPSYWIAKKERYNRSGALARRWLEASHIWSHTVLPTLRARDNPLRAILAYKKNRGMSFYTDVKDWLGGYPMEFAGNLETIAFGRDHLGLEIANLNAGGGNSEYLFRPTGCRNYWDEVLAARPALELRAPYSHDAGHCWIATLPDAAPAPPASLAAEGPRSMLYEDSIPLGFSRAEPAAIRTYGNGRFLHSPDDTLYFSTSDNSDPNTNARRYVARGDLG